VDDFIKMNEFNKVEHKTNELNVLNDADVNTDVDADNQSSGKGLQSQLLHD